MLYKVTPSSYDRTKVLMDLPKLSLGKRYTLPRPMGSADALLLANLAQRDKAAKA